ncbi:MAG: pyrimidine 5'-nucleotidase, partial [Alphaproteobacteria bacterium]
MDRSPQKLRDAEVWVFDLDNTLYHSSIDLFSQVALRINRFVQRRLGIDTEAATRVQREYFATYGSTLRGLMVRDGVDPHGFLEYVHDIDYGPLTRDRRLAGALARLRGRKFVFTNGSATHAAAVLRHLGLTDVFDAVFDIEAAGFVPKPRPEPYERLVERHAIEPTTAVMVEDLARNLEPAAAMGMTTLWVESRFQWAQPARDADYIDHTAEDLVAWLEAVLDAGV